MSEQPAAKKFTHAEVAYEHPAKGPEHCGECLHFIGAKMPRWQIVKSPIPAEDWCQRYRAKPNEAD